MAHTFYSTVEYKEKQSQKAKNAWKRRLVNFQYKTEMRKCARPHCGRTFVVPPHDPKIYCSQSCATQVTNRARGKRSAETRKKIAESLQGRPSPLRGTIKVPRAEVVCRNPNCGKRFIDERWKKTQFCCNRCAMTVIGGKPTSPKASKGKGGIRPDIHPTIYFYSRWEANIARLYTYLKIKWIYSPTVFDIGGQKYTPDFYLPEKGIYVEVKNFWWEYSRIRDEKFRKHYPDIPLEVILKEKYLELEKQYAHLIPKWEYKNSKS